MIDDVPPKVCFRKSGLLTQLKVATYLCLPTCILCECKTFLIGNEVIHNTLLIIVTKVTSTSCKILNMVGVGKAHLSMLTQIKCNGTVALIGISLFHLVPRPTRISFLWSLGLFVHIAECFLLVARSTSSMEWLEISQTCIAAYSVPRCQRGSNY